jgi:hypothetical protein
LAKKLNQGVDKALEYFLGDWIEEYPAYHKSAFPTVSYTVLPMALLLCGLTNRWDAAVKICSWCVDTAKHRFRTEQDEQVRLFLCIASDLSLQPLKGISEKLEQVRSSQAKRTRLLCAAWEATVAKDQKAFDKAFEKTVAYFLTIEAHDAPNPCYWVAEDQSVVWLIAERKGLKFPNVPEKLDAAVVRRQTIGLAKGGRKGDATFFFPAKSRKGDGHVYSRRGMAPPSDVKPESRAQPVPKKSRKRVASPFLLQGNVARAACLNKGRTKIW